MHVLGRYTTAMVCVALAAGPLPARAQETIRCNSHGFGHRYCPVDTGNRVELIHQHSLIHCREGRSWGYDRHGVWVDHGCSAEFRVGGHDRSRNRAAVAGVAIVGLAALAALSASKQSQAQAEVDAWAVGSFSGMDEFERTTVELSILPGGAVNGRAGSSDFTGVLKGSRLEAGRHVFRIERSGSGFLAIDEKDSAHRVLFHRVGSGY